ncbi:hypothetical protein D3H64_00420 [Atopobacter sp. AH10]|uniref:hypothetical protein n=1 Tax=Atopobacter sp. AH10 TaxID=2315861 RepID=UPI000EF1A122|nr:hypothetical protein [Atopobacter sp. AH10]RLK64278.1 hypothetical protein D3H64_00420 [Atopobacter sp. AH10]
MEKKLTCLWSKKCIILLIAFVGFLLMPQTIRAKSSEAGEKIVFQCQGMNIPTVIEVSPSSKEISLRSSNGGKAVYAYSVQKIPSTSVPVWIAGSEGQMQASIQLTILDHLDGREIEDIKSGETRFYIGQSGDGKTGLATLNFAGNVEPGQEHIDLFYDLTSGSIQDLSLEPVAKAEDKEQDSKTNTRTDQKEESKSKTISSEPAKQSKTSPEQEKEKKKKGFIPSSGERLLPYAKMLGGCLVLLGIALALKNRNKR